MTKIKTFKHALMISPNEIVMIDENRFYFTNDHKYTRGFGKFIEEYAGLTIANVVYFNGKDYREVANKIAYAKDINYDQKRNLTYIASVGGFFVKAYSKNEDGSLLLIEDIPCEIGVDNIEIDQSGNLWIGAHPNLLDIVRMQKRNLSH